MFRSLTYLFFFGLLLLPIATEKALREIPADFLSF